MEGLLFCNPADIKECRLKCGLRTGWFFSLDSDLYIGVNYDRQTNAVSFIFSKQPFAYD
jgi:hypothetical protein